MLLHLGEPLAHCAHEGHYQAGLLAQHPLDGLYAEPLPSPVPSAPIAADRREVEELPQVCRESAVDLAGVDQVLQRPSSIN